MTEVRLSFELERPTKNTVRYQEKPEENSPTAIGTLYVQKWWLGNPPPRSLVVTIEKES
jgi:hypothetical protein